MKFGGLAARFALVALCALATTVPAQARFWQCAPYAREIEHKLLAELDEIEIETLRRLTQKVVAAAKQVFEKQTVADAETD